MIGATTRWKNEQTKLSLRNTSLLYALLQRHTDEIMLAKLELPKNSVRVKQESVMHTRERSSSHSATERVTLFGK